MAKEKGRKVFRMLSYGFADMLGGGVNQVISVYYLTFLIYVVQLSPLQAGLVTGLGKIWDGFTDPLMGVIVDRTKAKMGACRLWLLIAVVPVFAGYFLLWNFFGIDTNTGKFIYFIFAYMLWSTAYTVGTIPYESLLPRMVSSYKERTNFSSVRMIFSGVACVASTYVYEWLVPVSADNPLSPAFTDNFILLGIVLGLWFSLPLIITVIGTKESPLPANRERLTLKSIFRDYKEVIKSKIFRKYYLLGLSGALVSSAINSSMVIFVYLIYGNITDFLFTFSLVFLVINLKGAVEIAFFVPNVVLMKKYNKHRPYLIDLPLIFIAAIMILFITPATPIWFMLIAMAILGAGSSCLNFVPMTLLPDLSDVDELIYGKRREGVNAGLTTLGKKLVYGLSLTLFGFILEIFGLDTQTASPDVATQGSILAVKIMFCILPISVSVLMLIVSRTYHLNASNHNTIVRLIAQKRETGEISASLEEQVMCEQISGVKFKRSWLGGYNQQLPS